jgi:UDP-2-acetamido-2-deoxy-ribo-hexuluronate aminotransferase
MKINYVNLSESNATNLNKYYKILNDICRKGEFADPEGKTIKEFEKNFRKYTGSKYAVSVNSGSSALYLALKALNLKKNDEVLTVAHSYVATVNSILLNDLKPVFCDIKNNLTIDEEDVKKKISKKTKAIILVHIQGTPVNFEKLMPIIKENNLKIIEDCAQAIGSTFKNKHVGNFGDIGCFSFHPLKNLSALGDGGMIVTKNKKIFEWLRKARINGHPHRDECDFPSHNMRLSNLQAGFLNLKLKNLNSNVIKKRRSLAKIYFKSLKDLVYIEPESKDSRNSYHTYIIQTKKRDKLSSYLKSKNIETKIHYPKPIHKMNYYKKKFGAKLINTEAISKKILSLPINEKLSLKEINYIISNIKKFFNLK